MNISGPLSISPVNPRQHPELDVRLFQRVTAQVLSVTGTTALLTIEGYPVVAQLASADQAATLLPQQTAQFIVTGRTSQKITLKVINDDQHQASLVRPVLQGPEIAVRLLEQQNIPVTGNHLIIARAIIKRHLALTPLLLNELSETLSAYGSWGKQEAEVAVALKAAGLPLNVHSLELASRQAAQIGDSLARLITKLTDMAGQDLPEELLKQLELSLQTLKSMVLKADGEPDQLAEQLKAAVEMLGASLENRVLEQLQNSKTPPENNLLSLPRLQRSLEQAGKNELADLLRNFLKDVQQSQFLNTKHESIAAPGEWTEIGFAIQNVQQKTGDLFSSARLRIGHEPGSGSRKRIPEYTRIILQVNVSPKQTVEVDLAIVDRQIKTSVTSPDIFWCQSAQEELPTLEQALQALGFTLRDTQINLGEPPSFDRFVTTGDTPLMTVDIEA